MAMGNFESSQVAGDSGEGLALGGDGAQSIPRPRIAALDVLRGVAVLGILLMNVQSMSMPENAYTNPTFYGDFSGWNYRVWLLSHVLADMKFITIFSMLFGAGMVLQSESAGNRHPVRRHYCRMVVLLSFGLAHAYLLWYGDILVAYAVCGMMLFWARKLPGTWLLGAGLLLIAAGTGVYWGLHDVHSGPFTWLRAWDRRWAPDFWDAEAELQAYGGSWVTQMGLRVPAARYFETVVFVEWTFWRCAGCMLMGMGLLKLRVLTGAVRGGRWTLAGMAVAGIGAGMALSVLGVVRNSGRGWDLDYLFWPGMQFNYWGSLLTALGYVGAVVWAVGVMVRKGWGRVWWPLEAVGRMALTNYIGQTVLATAVFYGHGLGWFGETSRVGQLGVVVAIWAVEVVWSVVWLRYFKQGPLEWLWRGLAYRVMGGGAQGSVIG